MEREPVDGAEEEEEVACECCGFTEECTAPYVRGRWICVLCGDAVGEELGRASPPIFPAEALDCHACVCRGASAPPSPAGSPDDLIAALRLLRRRRLGSSPLPAPRKARSTPSSPRRDAAPGGISVVAAVATGTAGSSLAQHGKLLRRARRMRKKSKMLDVGPLGPRHRLPDVAQAYQLRGRDMNLETFASLVSAIIYEKSMACMGMEGGIGAAAESENWNGEDSETMALGVAPAELVAALYLSGCLNYFLFEPIFLTVYETKGIHLVRGTSMPFQDFAGVAWIIFISFRYNFVLDLLLVTKDGRSEGRSALCVYHECCKCASSFTAYGLLISTFFSMALMYAQFGPAALVSALMLALWFPIEDGNDLRVFFNSRHLQ